MLQISLQEYSAKLEMHMYRYSAFLSVLFVFFLVQTTYTQPCLPGGIILSTQKQIDDFPTNYPGCREVLGSVRIEEKTPGAITNLLGLKQLSSIQSDLFIRNNTALKNFNGLEGIGQIGRNLYIKNNGAIKDLQGLNGLKRVGGKLKIRYNGALEHLTGIGGLSVVKGEIWVHDNIKLKDLVGLENLDTVSDNIKIYNSPSIHTLEGIGDIYFSNGAMMLHDNANLESLAGPRSVRFESIAGQNLIEAFDNPKLSQCSVDFLCDHIDQHGTSGVILNDNAVGCNTLREVMDLCVPNRCLPGGMRFTSQRQLDEMVDMYPDCEEIYGSVIVEDTTSGDITSLKGLRNIRRIWGTLTIKNNKILSDLDGLQQLEVVNRGLIITGNPGLKSVEELQHLDILQLGTPTGSESTVIIKDNPLLSKCSVDFLCAYAANRKYKVRVENNGAGCSSPGELYRSCGLTICYPSGLWIKKQAQIDDIQKYYPGCTEIPGGLRIGYCGINTRATAHIVNLKGFSTLQKVGSYLQVCNTSGLIDLKDLQHLESVYGPIKVWRNNSLESLAGLENIHPESLNILDGRSSNDFEVYQNPLLSECDIPGVCDWLNIEGFKAKIQENKGDCEDVDKLKARCDAQCPHNPVRIENQSDLDAFNSRYPTCKVIYGDLIIEEKGQGDITNLAALKNIREVKGALTIKGNASLNTLEGLSNLELVGAPITIQDNSALTTLRGLRNLDLAALNASVADRPALIIRGNKSLSDCALDNFCSIFKLVDFRLIVEDNGAGCMSRGELWDNCALDVCLPGTTVFHNQKEIDDFAVSFTGCETALGKIVIREEERGGITDLSGLASLRVIRGGLSIEDNFDLTGLHGLENLDSIGGDGLNIANNTKLTSLTGLASLAQLDGKVRIYHNDSLVHLTGLSNFKTTNWQIEIVGNMELTDIAALESLEFQIHDGKVHLLRILGNPKLKKCQLSVFCPLLSERSVKEDFRFNGRGCKSVHEVMLRCTNGESCAQTVTLKRQSQIDSFSILYPDCSVVEGDLIIEGEMPDEVRDLSPLRQIEEVQGDLRITNNRSLDSLVGLENLRRIGGNLTISSNHALPHLDELARLIEIAGYINISENDALVSIEGVRNILPQSITSDAEKDLQLYNNPVLSQCAIQNLCRLLDLPGRDFDIHDNGANCNSSTAFSAACDEAWCILGDQLLTSQKEIDDFKTNYPDCSNLAGSLIIKEATAGDIRDLSGLKSLTTVAGDLIIQGNSKLKTLDGLENLTSLGGRLTVAGNTQLMNLHGLANIDPATIVARSKAHSDIEILNNPALDSCANPSLCVFLRMAYKKIEVHDNGQNCQTRRQIGEACGYPTVCKVANFGFNGQRDIDLFPYRYPGCRIIEPGEDEILRIYNATSLKPMNQVEIIRGGLHINKNSSLVQIDGFDNLQLVKELNLSYMPSLITLKGFENLQYVTGPLHIISDPFLSEVDAFHALKSVRGDLNINTNPNLTEVRGFEHVTKVNGSVNIKYDDLLKKAGDFGELETLKEGIRLVNLKSLKQFSPFSSLRKVNGELRVQGCKLMRDLAPFDSISEVDNLVVIDNMNLNALSGGNKKFTQIGGLLLQDLPVLKGMDELSNIDTIDGSVFLRNLDALTSLRGLRSLKTTGGHLQVKDCNGLQSLKGLDNLNSIGAALLLTACEKIEHFDALSALTSVSGRVEIAGNPRLTSLYGLRNINPQGVHTASAGKKDLEVYSNPLLTDCQYKNICHLLIRHRVFIESNGMGCNAGTDLNCLTGQAISGVVFYDRNKSKDFSFIDDPLDFIKVRLNPGNMQAFARKEDGVYVFFLDSTPGTYHVSVDTNAYWALTTDSLDYTVHYKPDQPENGGKDFGFYPRSGTPNVSAILVTQNARCFENAPYELIVTNYGGTPLSLDACLHLDSLTPPVSLPPMTPSREIDGKKYYCFHVSLPPSASRHFPFVVRMPGSDHVGEVLNYDILIQKHIDAGGWQTILHSYKSTVVKCSYDPNDKQVSPVGEGTERKVPNTEPLQYTIRFQNTGNDVAYDIRILDTIDRSLDISTFKLLYSSHPVLVNIKDYVVEFRFNSIFLPDSTTDEMKSHGQVLYEIKPKKGLENNTIVRNTAHIIFDYNPAVVTNTTSSLLVKKIVTFTGDRETAGGFVVFPNPAGQWLEVLHPNHVPIDKMTLIDCLGKPVREVNAKHMKVSGLPPGLYDIRIQSKTNTYNVKVILR